MPTYPAGDVQASYLLDTTQAEAGASRMEQLFVAMADKLGPVGELLDAGNLSMIAFGVAAVEAGEEFEKSFQQLDFDIGTSSSNIDALKSQMEDLYTGTQEGMGSIEKVVVAISQRTNITGDAAEKLADKFLKVGHAYGMSPEQIADDMTAIQNDYKVGGDAIDKFVAAHEASGVSISELESTVRNMGPTLRGMNYSLDDTIAMMANFSKAGIAPRQMLIGLQRGFNHVGSREALQQQMSEIQTLLASGTAIDESKATEIAKSLFGFQSPRFMDAIRLGVFDTQDMIGKIASTSPNAAAKEIDNTLEGQFTLLLHEANTKLAPIGLMFMDVAKAALPVANVILKIVGAIVDNPASIEVMKWVLAFEAIQRSVVPLASALSGIISSVRTMEAPQLFTAFGQAASTVAGAATNPVVTNVGGPNAGKSSVLSNEEVASARGTVVADQEQAAAATALAQAQTKAAAAATAEAAATRAQVIASGDATSADLARVSAQEQQALALTEVAAGTTANAQALTVSADILKVNTDAVLGNTAALTDNGVALSDTTGLAEATAAIDQNTAATGVNTGAVDSNTVAVTTSAADFTTDAAAALTDAEAVTVTTDAVMGLTRAETDGDVVMRRAITTMVDNTAATMDDAKATDIDTKAKSDNAAATDIDTKAKSDNAAASQAQAGSAALGIGGKLASAAGVAEGTGGAGIAVGILGKLALPAMLAVLAGQYIAEEGEWIIDKVEHTTEHEASAKKSGAEASKMHDETEKVTAEAKARGMTYGQAINAAMAAGITSEGRGGGAHMLEKYFATLLPVETIAYISDQSHKLAEQQNTDAEKLLTLNIAIADAKQLASMPEGPRNSDEQRKSEQSLALQQLKHDQMVETNKIEEDHLKQMANPDIANSTVKKADEEQFYKNAKTHDEEVHARQTSLLKLQQQIANTDIERAEAAEQAQDKLNDTRQKGDDQVAGDAADLVRLQEQYAEATSDVERTRIDGEEKLKILAERNDLEKANFAMMLDDLESNMAISAEDRRHNVAMANRAQEHALFLQGQQVAQQTAINTYAEKLATWRQQDADAQIKAKHAQQESGDAALDIQRKLDASRAKAAYTHDPTELIAGKKEYADLQEEQYIAGKLAALSAEQLSIDLDHDDESKRHRQDLLDQTKEAISEEKRADLDRIQATYDAAMLAQKTKDEWVKTHDAEKKASLDQFTRETNDVAESWKEQGQLSKALTGSDRLSRDAEYYGNVAKLQIKKHELDMQFAKELFEANKLADGQQEARKAAIRVEEQDAYADMYHDFQQENQKMGLQHMLEDIDKAKSESASLFESNPLLHMQGFEQGAAFYKAFSTLPSQAMNMPYASLPSSGAQTQQKLAASLALSLTINGFGGLEAFVKSVAGATMENLRFGAGIAASPIPTPGLF